MATNTKTSSASKKAYNGEQQENMSIGFKRLLELSLLKPPDLTVEIANRPGFWNLLDEDLKGNDYIVLIVKILANIYKSLMPGEESKIVYLLKNRFEKSYFLKVLNEYLIGLPKITDFKKRINSFLWNDVQSFFLNVLLLCQGMFSHGGNSIEQMKIMNDLLKTLKTSALCVRQEFNNSLFEQIHGLRTVIKTKYSTNKGPVNTSINDCKTKAVDLNSSKDKLVLTSFKNLSIFPTKEDLLHENNVLIQPNIINGAYPNVECYLDLQFKLLREDCFGPLRDGICKYMGNPSKKRHDNIRVHPKVRIIGTYLKNNKIGHLVDIAWNERSTNDSVDSKKYAHSKQLMLGSLLLFTCNNFDTVLCATVLDCKSLDAGYIAVQFQNPVSNSIFAEPYLMVESEVYFEPYHRVLKVIQNSGLDDLPMRKYIVDVQKDIKSPSYLTLEKMYTITDPSTLKDIRFPVLATANSLASPFSSFGLEQYQMQAYVFALTREFAVIQGPPGTGKTYLGVKIASTLLRNLSLTRTPMLIICLKNHALDQFLEGILEVTTNVVRLGSQSKSEKLKPYYLSNLKTKTKSKYNYKKAIKKAELEKIFKQITHVQTEIEKCEKEILSYKPYIKSTGLIRYKEDPIWSWLFKHLEMINETLKDENWKKQIENLRDEDKLEICRSANLALNEIDSMFRLIKLMDFKYVTDNQFEILAVTIEKKIFEVREMSNYFETIQLKGEGEENMIDRVKNLKIMTTKQRWMAFVLATVITIKNGLLNKRNQLLEKHNACIQKLEEMETLTDYEIMKSAKVVGVTTTVAARRHDLMKKLSSPIVIVEEAAEVLEAHIVASLTHKCQHLILIGDHKQLRPTASHYKLAKHYNLDIISLFERMVRNNVHSRTLTVQRRMRREFVDLLVPSTYDRLDCHPSVDQYKHVRGMTNDLYFLCHDVLKIPRA